jgi:hypothetical protein
MIKTCGTHHWKNAFVISLLLANAVWAITFQADVAGVNGFNTVDKISWTDSRGLVREACFAKDY